MFRLQIVVWIKSQTSWSLFELPETVKVKNSEGVLHNIRVILDVDIQQPRLGKNPFTKCGIFGKWDLKKPKKQTKQQQQKKTPMTFNLKHQKKNVNYFHTLSYKNHY